MQVSKRGLRARSVYLILLILTPSVLYVFAAIHKPAPYLVARISQPILASKETTLVWPTQGGAAIGSLEEGLLSQSLNSEVPRPTASIAKVITALAVLEKKPISNNTQGATITLDQTDLDFYNDTVNIGGSNVPVENGEQITEVQALEAMLLPSANNMANTMAFWAFGSTEAYVTYANTMVKNWGLKSTVIADASGISTSTVSTPSDLVKIGQRFLNNPTLHAISSEKTAVIPVAGSIYNTNVLLGSDGITGIKTGHSNDAGAGLLFAADYAIDETHSTTIIGVVQAIPTVQESFLSAQALLASAKKGFSKSTVIKAGQKVGSYTSDWGNETPIYSQQDIAVYGWSGTAPKTTIYVNDKKTTVRAKENVGTIKVQAAGKTYTAQLIAGTKIPAASMAWRLRETSNIKRNR